MSLGRATTCPGPMMTVGVEIEAEVPNSFLAAPAIMFVSSPRASAKSAVSGGIGHLANASTIRTAASPGEADHDGADDPAGEADDARVVELAAAPAGLILVAPDGRRQAGHRVITSRTELTNGTISFGSILWTEAGVGGGFDSVAVADIGVNLPW